jgi:hypothetical protein
VIRGRIEFGSGGSQAQFTAVYDHGDVAGLATGHGGERNALVGNLSAGFSTTGGFTGGKLGGGSAGGSAVLLAAGSCSSSDSKGSSGGDGKGGDHRPKHGK